jgi:hypothetical protein
MKDMQILTNDIKNEDIRYKLPQKTESHDETNTLLNDEHLLINQIRNDEYNKEQDFIIHNMICALWKVGQYMDFNFQELPPKFQGPYQEFINLIIKMDLQKKKESDVLNYKDISEENIQKIKKLYKDFREFAISTPLKIFCEQRMPSKSLHALTATVCPIFGSCSYGITAGAELCPIATGLSTACGIGCACFCVCDLLLVCGSLTECFQISKCMEEYKQITKTHKLNEILLQ